MNIVLDRCSFRLGPFPELECWSRIGNSITRLCGATLIIWLLMRGGRYGLAIRSEKSMLNSMLKIADWTAIAGHNWSCGRLLFLIGYVHRFGESPVRRWDWQRMESFPI